MELASGLQLDTTKGYTVKVPDGSEPRDLIDTRDNLVVKNILSGMTRACDSDANVSFVIDKVTVQSLKIDVYAVDMYVETNTDILMDELNSIVATYPSRIQRRIKLRTVRRPDIPTLYATRVHLDITTYDYALVPSRIDVVHIYSPAVPLKRNAVTGVYASVANAGDHVRHNARKFVEVSPEPGRGGGGSWTDTIGSIFGRTSAPPPPQQTTDFIVLENNGNPRPLKRPRVATNHDQ